MQSTLTLTSPLLKDGINPTAVAAAVYQSAAELEADIKTHIQQSVPTGRTYRRSAIVRRSTRNNRGIGLRSRGNRTIVGFNFHRASRSGQPPAILTGRLINSIRSLRNGPFSARVICGVNYGLVLDSPLGLNRPFFIDRAQRYRTRFVENIRNAAFG